MTQDLPPRAADIFRHLADLRFLRAIVECELHERIFQGTWRVVPAFTSQDANAAN